MGIAFSFSLRMMYNLHGDVRSLYRWYDPKCGNLWDSISIALMKADYHGALLKVKHSKCHTLIGLEGIVIFDTKFTFTIVGKDNTSRSEYFGCDNIIRVLQATSIRLRLRKPVSHYRFV